MLKLKLKNILKIVKDALKYSEKKFLFTGLKPLRV